MNNYKEEDEEQIEVSTYAEGLLISILKGYEDAFNKTNDKYNIKFTLTITNHKQATPDGNKDLAYLRIERGVKEKEDKEGEWPMTMVVHDMFIFKDLQERLNSKAPWKEQLYVNVIAKLVAGGVEYAELLKRTKAAREESKKVEENKPNLDLVTTTVLPSPLTPAEEEYKTWLKQERIKEGIN